MIEGYDVFAIPGTIDRIYEDENNQIKIDFQELMEMS